MARRRFGGISQDGHAMAANHLTRILARCLVYFCPISRQLPGAGNRNAAAFPGEQLARKLAIRRATVSQYLRRSPRNRKCNIPRKISQDDSSKFWHHLLNQLTKIMNSQTTSTPNLELLRQAVQEFQPAPSRIPFHALRPYHEFIVLLRAKRASYRSVAELLEQQGVKTSVARVAEYGRIVLDGKKTRKRRKRTPIAPTATVPAPTPIPPLPIAATDSLQPPSRGPRIANIRMLKDKVASNQTS